MIKHASLLALAALLPLSAATAALADDAMATSAPVTVKLQAQNGSGETGTATLTQKGSDVVVHLTITKGTGDAQPAHIHPGTCANLDPKPKYPLTNVVDGESLTTIKGVKLADLETGAFAINVHKSTSDLKDYVACGDIPKAPAMGGM
jgi:hypothetical protein